MKVVQINATCASGSTGKICAAVSCLLTKRNIENYILYAVGSSISPLGTRYMTDREIKMQALRARILGNYGFQSKRATQRLIRELNRISPKIVHLHNLHSHNVHLGMLFSYLKENKIKIYWTFHDCWAITGYCAHYDMVGCDKWKTGCSDCPQRSHSSWFFDRSHYLYGQKKKLFTDLDLTIITPSEWLAYQVRQSFLRDCPIKVINNGVDLSVFAPRESDFRQKYNLDDKYIVLGVTFGWGRRKGLDVFTELSKRLGEEYQIVLVGTDDKIDKQLPDNIVSIHRTNNQVELAEIYTAADVFVNPTREDTFPTTHMEALACGTPVIAFDTGGCAEMLNEKCGAVVEKEDVTGLAEKIVSVCEDCIFSSEACIARAKDFDQKDKFEEYVKLYRSI